MSIKFSVYSCMAPDYKVEELASKIRELGYDGIEWTVGYKNALWDNSKEWHLSEANIEDEVSKLKDICDKFRLEICALGTGVKYNEIERFKRLANQSNILGCKKLRVCMQGYNEDMNYYELCKDVVKNLKVIQMICKDYKVRGLLETHMGTIIPSASSVIRIVENFDPEYIGVIYDPGNMVHEGYERWQMGIEILGKYLAHVHAKNYGWFLKEIDGKKKWVCEATSLKDGMADYKDIMNSLKKVGYNGYISFEDFRGGYCCYPVGITTEEKMKEDLVYLKSLYFDKNNRYQLLKQIEI